MEFVLDANVLFRTLISGGDILDIFFNKELQLIAPEKLKEEFLKNKNGIIEKSRLTEAEFKELSTIIFKMIVFMSRREYSQHIGEAKKLLKKHEKDEDFIALCLLRKTKVWTYEKRLLDLGFGISTKEIADILLG